MDAVGTASDVDGCVGRLVLVLPPVFTRVELDVCIGGLTGGPPEVLTKCEVELAEVPFAVPTVVSVWT